MNKNNISNQNNNQNSNQISNQIKESITIDKAQELYQEYSVVMKLLEDK